MTSRRLIPESAIADAEANLAAAVRQAVDEQRGTVQTALRSHGLTAAGVSSAQVWSSAAWTKTVQKHVAPVATAVAVGLAAKGAQALATSAAWGASVATTAMATHIVNTTLKAGERIGSVLAHAADTEEGVLAAVDSALDSAAGWVSDLAGRLAVTIGNWVVSDLAVHLGEQQPVTVTLTWNTVGDNAVRQDHVDADGQTVGAGDPFDVGGEELMFPGDPMGSDENTINCRCFLTTDDGSEYDPSAETENVSPFGD